MFNVNKIRIDERLAHGQILLKWLKVSGSSKVVIIDNELATDPIMNRIIKLTFPKNIQLDIFSIKEVIPLIKSKKIYKDTFVIIKSLYTAKTLFDNGFMYKEISLGNISTGVGKKKLTYNLFLSTDELEIIEYFINKEIKVVVQSVPDSEPIYIDNINKIIDKLE